MNYGGCLGDFYAYFVIVAVEFVVFGGGLCCLACCFGDFWVLLVILGLHLGDFWLLLVILVLHLGEFWVLLVNYACCLSDCLALLVMFLSVGLGFWCCW